MKIPVSEFIVRFMERLGIRHIFGMPGAHILPVYDALHGSSIRTVLAKHEQGAAFMAGGYARASGRIGACITTAGPGATNLVTGIANAYADHLPVLAVTGETSTHIFGRGGLQESSGEGGAIDQAALFQSITRYARLVERTDYLPNVLNRAARILLSKDPGPVLLSFPFNLQKELVEEELLERIAIHSSAGNGGPDPALLDRLCGHLLAAEHPVIVAGYGCIRAGAQPLVERLSRRLGAPVATSLKAKGVIGEDSPLSLGSLGVTSGGHACRHILERADLLLFLGAGFNERTSYTWDDALLEGRTLLQVDHDPEQLEKVFRADLAVAGDIGEVLAGLLARLGGEEAAGEREHRVPPADGKREAGSAFLSGFGLVERFFRALERRFPGPLMVFDDNIIFAQNLFQVSPRNRYFPNSGISSLGHAIPAAIGARFVEEAPTFAILGDGGFQMCGMELMTAVNYRIPLNVVLF
ncbi:MAG TPA: thiamine pyrophosphate-binding protein, partial [Thiolapillus brandeum]|nr:thiamine pyrophosphate-binding protein [Thiolapillus brandeum]